MKFYKKNYVTKYHSNVALKSIIVQCVSPAYGIFRNVCVLYIRYITYAPSNDDNKYNTKI